MIAVAGRLLLAFVVLVIVESALQAVVGPKVGERFGFEISGDYVIAGGRQEEVPMIVRVDSGGAFARAGFVEGDILVDHISKGLLYLSLRIAGSGDTRTITVVPGGDGPRIGRRAKRRLTVVAP